MGKGKKKKKCMVRHDIPKLKGGKNYKLLRTLYKKQHIFKN